MTKDERLKQRELLLEANEWKALALVYRKQKRALVKKYEREAVKLEVALEEAQDEVENIDARWRKSMYEIEALKKTLKFRADYKQKWEDSRDTHEASMTESRRLRRIIDEQLEKLQESSNGDPGLMAIRAIAVRLGIPVSSPLLPSHGGTIQIGKLAPVRFDYARMQADIDAKLVELMARPR